MAGARRKARRSRDVIQEGASFQLCSDDFDDPDSDTGSPSLRRLREIVAGKDGTFPRSRSMALLLSTDFPNKHRDFEAVLETNERRASCAISRR